MHLLADVAYQLEQTSPMCIARRTWRFSVYSSGRNVFFAGCASWFTVLARPISSSAR